MKKLLILLVAFSVNANAQLIGITMSQINRSTVPVPEIVNSFQDEEAYFSAYFLPISEKANLQSALDTYGSVRLDAGDYSGTAITIGSNQKLYGHTFITTVPNITIAGGSSNFHIENIRMVNDNSTLTFGTGGVISNFTIKNTTILTITSSGAQVENGKFYNIRSRININNSLTGYFRNNTIIKHQVHGISPQLVMKGNSVTPSYGNKHIWSNYLTPQGVGVDLDNLQEATFIGLDSEGWNISNMTTQAMFKATNMGDVNITDMGGANGYCTGCETPAFDIEADNLYFINKLIANFSGLTNPSKARANTNVYNILSLDDDLYDVEGTGNDIRLHYEGTDINYNGVNYNSLLSNETIINDLKSFINRTENPPIDKPIFEAIPNVTGDNWKTERVGKPDSRDYIQGLIDANNIAELDEGIYYIGSTLYINGDVDAVQGIVGKGTGKTAIVGLTDDFPLIETTYWDGSSKYLLSNLTLQGGHTGLKFPTEIDQVAFSDFKYLVFRDQEVAIHIDHIFGFDNIFFDHLNIVNCGIGLLQSSENEWDSYAYIDKVVFNKSQFINNGIAISMFATRANNLNMWIDCLFDGNDIAVELSGTNFPLFVNSTFKNHSGDYIMELQSSPSFYNCLFEDNTATHTFYAKSFIMEGTEIKDSSILNKQDEHWVTSAYIINSKIKGNKGYITHGVFQNSTFEAHPNYSKKLVNIKESSIYTTIIDEASTPYPQLLVKH